MHVMKYTSFVVEKGQELHSVVRLPLHAQVMWHARYEVCVNAKILCLSVIQQLLKL